MVLASSRGLTRAYPRRVLALVYVVAVVLVLGVLPLWWARGTRRMVWVLPLAVAATGVALLVGWNRSGEPTPVASVRAVDAGRTLEVSYVGGECDDQGTVTVDERRDRVEVLVVTRSLLADSCSDVAVEVTKKAPLRDPLGDREVVDTTCGCRVEQES